MVVKRGIRVVNVWRITLVTLAKLNVVVLFTTFLSTFQAPLLNEYIWLTLLRANLGTPSKSVLNIELFEVPSAPVFFVYS